MTKFTRTAKAAKESKGQAALVLAALSTETGKTIPEITAAIVEAGLKTVQAPERIAAYYLTIFKKQGIVTASVEETPADDTDAVAESDEDASDDLEESDDETDEVGEEDLVRN